MTTPTFDDLTPPDDLTREWFRYNPSRVTTEELWRHIATEAARWGARHGYEHARQLWPKPITDRPPTEADFDEYGWIQVVDDSGFWKGCHWETPVKGRPWLRTPRWQPRQPTLKEQALALVGRFESGDDFITHEEVEIIRRALEQAGEGQP
jgi:hypothetical protein